MNALDRIGLNPLPLQIDTMVTGASNGLGARTAGPGAGSVAQQQTGLANGGPNLTRPQPAVPPAVVSSTYATVSTGAHVLDVLSRLPSETPQIVAGKPLCPVPPSASAAGTPTDAVAAHLAAAPSSASPLASANPANHASPAHVADGDSNRHVTLGAAVKAEMSLAAESSLTGDGVLASPGSSLASTLSEAAQASSGTAAGSADSSGTSATNANNATATGTAATTHASSTAGLPAAGANFTGLLAKALIQSIESSGLFYESHLAQWAAGQRPITSLDREPQSRLVPLPSPSSSAPGTEGGRGTATSSTSTPLLSMLYGAIGGTGSGAAGGATDALSRAAATLGQFASSFTGGAAVVSGDKGTAMQGGTADPALQAIHPDIMSTVKQQLELLQNPTLRWSGEAWPGTRMDWEIERRDEHAPRAGGDSAIEPAWRMHLSLDLPQLGHVDAELHLVGTRLMARLKAPADSAASLLHDSDNFRQRIAGTGLELKGFAVKEANDGGPHDG